MAAKRNPLSPGAYADESAPCALTKPPGCGLAFDDRSGVHVTDDWGLALRYALFKAGASASVAIVLTYDMQGLKLEPDFDAKVEQQQGLLRESSWYVEEFDILKDPDDPDYDRLADVLEGDFEGRGEEHDGPPWNVISELVQASRVPIEAVVVEHLRSDDEAEAREALDAVVAGKAPLEYHAEAIRQWRTFSEVGDDRLLRVEVIKPVKMWIEAEDEGDAEACPMELSLDDIDDIPSAVEIETLWERREPRGAEVYYHGTDLTRAESILEGTDIELSNPWAPCVQTEE